MCPPSSHPSLSNRPGQGTSSPARPLFSFSEALARVANRKHRRFVEEFLVDLDGTKAAIRAGFKPSNASTRAWSLLRRQDVSEAVSAGQREMSERVEVRQDKVLAEYMAVAFADIGQYFDDHGNLLPLQEIPEMARKAISEIQVFEEYAFSEGERVPIGQTKRLKFHDKLKALDALGRNLGLFNADTSKQPQVNVLAMLLQRIDGRGLPKISGE